MNADHCFKAIRILLDEGVVKHITTGFRRGDFIEQREYLFETDEYFVVRASPIELLSKEEWNRIVDREELYEYYR